LIPATPAAGAGVNAGQSVGRQRPYYQVKKWLEIPLDAILDALWIHILVIPLRLIASFYGNSG
jgi:hypothetical protein